MNFLDASVVIAFYIEEPHSERVQRVYRHDAGLYLSELVGPPSPLARYALAASNSMPPAVLQTSSTST